MKKLVMMMLVFSVLASMLISATPVMASDMQESPVETIWINVTRYINGQLLKPTQAMVNARIRDAVAKGYMTVGSPYVDKFGVWWQRMARVTKTFSSYNNLLNASVVPFYWNSKTKCYHYTGTGRAFKCFGGWY